MKYVLIVCQFVLVLWLILWMSLFFCLSAAPGIPYLKIAVMGPGLIMSLLSVIVLVGNRRWVNLVVYILVLSVMFYYSRYIIVVGAKFRVSVWGGSDRVAEIVDPLFCDSIYVDDINVCERNFNGSSDGFRETKLDPCCYYENLEWAGCPSKMYWLFLYEEDGKREICIVISSFFKKYNAYVITMSSGVKPEIVGYTNAWHIGDGVWFVLLN